MERTGGRSSFAMVPLPVSYWIVAWNGRESTTANTSSSSTSTSPITWMVTVVDDALGGIVTTVRGTCW